MSFTMTDVTETITHKYHFIQHNSDHCLKALLALIEADAFKLALDPFVFNRSMVYKNLKDNRFRAVLMFTEIGHDAYALKEFNVFDDSNAYKAIAHCNFDVKEVYKEPIIEELYCVNTFLDSMVVTKGFSLLSADDVADRQRQLIMSVQEELGEYQVTRPLINVIVKGGVVQAVYSSIKDPAISVIDLDAINVNEEEITLQVQDQYKIY